MCHGFEDMTADKEASLLGESGLALRETEPPDLPVSWVVREDQGKLQGLNGQAACSQGPGVEHEAFPHVSSSCANHRAAVSVQTRGVPSPHALREKECWVLERSKTI